MNAEQPQVSTVKLLGHEPQRSKLKQLYLQNRLPHTLMFSGREGVGKKLVAVELSKAILSDSSDAHESSRLVERGNHPDYHLLELANKEVNNTKTIRGKLSELQLKPYMGGNRVVLLNDADKLSQAAANILLKSLEEPNADTYYLLVAANPARLPQTVLSRCQKWHFEELRSDQLESILTEKLPKLNQDERNELAAMLDGSMAELEILQEHGELWERVKQLLSSIDTKQLSQAMLIGKGVAQNKETLSVALHFMRILSRQAMHKAKTEQARCLWACFLANIMQAYDLIFERNFNATYLLNEIWVRYAGENFTPEDVNKRFHLI